MNYLHKIENRYFIDRYTKDKVKFYEYRYYGLRQNRIHHFVEPLQRGPRCHRH